MPVPDLAVLPKTFRYQPTCPRIVFGVGSIDELRVELDLLGAERVLLVADRPTTALEGIRDRVVDQFQDIRQHVPTRNARSAVDRARQVDADALLCIGGGSTTGTAKAVALETGLPIIAVPITYAGSEVTPVYGLTDGRTKTTGRSATALPRTVIYDPALAIGLPRRLSIHSAVNALAHCAAALHGDAASPVTDLLALEGARRLSVGIRTLGNRESDLPARSELAYGSYLAGSVFAVVGSGLHHTICHVLGGAYDLPHAETHSAVLPYVLKFLQQNEPDQDHRLAAAMDSKVTDSGDAVLTLLAEAEESVRLRDLGMTEDQLDKAADLLAEQFAKNLSPISREQVLSILRRSL